MKFYSIQLTNYAFTHNEGRGNTIFFGLRKKHEASLQIILSAKERKYK
jgi:hypothetical protein